MHGRAVLPGASAGQHGVGVGWEGVERRSRGMQRHKDQRSSRCIVFISHSLAYHSSPHLLLPSLPSPRLQVGSTCLERGYLMNQLWEYQLSLISSSPHLLLPAPPLPRLQVGSTCLERGFLMNQLWGALRTMLHAMLQDRDLAWKIACEARQQVRRWAALLWLL